MKHKVKLLYALTLIFPFMGLEVFANENETAIWLQRLLAEKAYYSDSIDGNFGNKSKNALRNFCQTINVECDVENIELVKATFLSLGIEPDTLYAIPVFHEYDFKISNQNILFVDAKSGNFNRCQETINNNLRLYPYDLNSIISKYSLLFSSDIFEASGRDYLVIDPLTNEFGSTVYKQGSACLMGQIRACQDTLELVRLMRSSNALTENSSPSRDDPETYYLTNDRILAPLIVSYSYAIQRLGRPNDDIANAIWLKNAIYQNTYDPRPNAWDPERDFERTGLGNCKGDLQTAAGQNHQTQAGLIYEMWGVLWNSPDYASVGLDAADAALASVDSKGALVCDASRGANAIGYIGTGLSNLISIMLIAKNQGNDLNSLQNIANLHRAVKFQLDAVYDPSIVFPYAKRNIVSWCDDNYRNQCFHSAGLQGLAFSWVIPYLKLFPEHENADYIRSIFQAMVGPKIEDTNLLRNLNAFVAGKIPTNDYRHNLLISPDMADDANLTYFDSFSFTGRGSQVCMFGDVQY